MTAWTVAAVPRPEDPVDDVDERRRAAASPRGSPASRRCAIVRWSAWSARNSIPGHGVHAIPRPDGRRCRAGRRAGAPRPSSACCSARRVAWTFQRSTPMCVSATSSEVDEPAQPEREHGRHEAQPDVEPVDAQRRPAVPAAGRLVDRDPVVLEHEVGEQVREDQPREDEDGVGHAAPAGAGAGCRGRGPGRRAPRPPRTSARAPRRAPRGGGPARAPRSPRRSPGSRPGAPRPPRGGAPRQEQPRDLALAVGELGEQRGQHRADVQQQRVRGGIAGLRRAAPRAASSRARAARARR